MGSFLIAFWIGCVSFCLYVWWEEFKREEEELKKEQEDKL